MASKMNEKNVRDIVMSACVVIFFLNVVVALPFGLSSPLALLVVLAYLFVAYMIVPFVVFQTVRKKGVRALNWVSMWDPLVILLFYVVGYGALWVYALNNRDNPIGLGLLLLYYPWVVNLCILVFFIVYCLVFSLVRKCVEAYGGRGK